MTMEGTGHKGHKDGIEAHVAIYLQPGRDIWALHAAIVKVKGVHGLTVIKVHVSLGEIDMIADVHAAWTDEDPKHARGMETRLIGDWVNAVRQLHPDDGHAHDASCNCYYVARTSTNVCMMPDS